MKRLINILLAACIMLVACSKPHSQSSKMPISIDPELLSIANEYVAVHRHWKQTEYRVESLGVENGQTILMIVYLNDEKSLKTGGASFVIYVENTHVVKEAKLQ